ncbi:hypothetical protein AMATHDRAFT_167318, partial [Amanita thiersii Skay4041]
KLAAARRYEADYKAVIKDFKFRPGDLVLVRNSSIENSLNRKMKPRYLGPMVIVAVTKRGNYVVCEMDGSVWQQQVAAFRVMPYFARKKVSLPENIRGLIDVSAEGLSKILGSPAPPEEQEDLSFAGVKLTQEDN